MSDNKLHEAVDKLLEEINNYNPMERMIPLEKLALYKESLFNHTSHPVNPDKFLEIVLDTHAMNEESIRIQYDLTRFAIEKGANISNVDMNDIDIGLLWLLKDFIAPTVLLNTAASAVIREGREATQFSVIEYALGRGAEVNQLIKQKTGDVHALDLVPSPEAINLLLQHGAECSPYSDRMKAMLEAHGLDEYTEVDLAIKSKQLSDALIASNKFIPTITGAAYSIWFTHPSSPREMFNTDVENIINNKNMLMNDGISYIILSNNPELIPNSVKTLEENGIEVRDISEEIKSWDLIEDLINEKSWGMASDMARVEWMAEHGGIYFDSNFALTESLRPYISKYDFFSKDLVNYQFAAKPNHPVIMCMREMMRDNLQNPPSYIATISDEDAMVKTSFTTLFPFGMCYIKHANTDGNVDISYPEEYMAIKRGNEVCPTALNIFSFQKQLGYSTEEIMIGEDGYKSAGYTWLEEQEVVPYNHDDQQYSGVEEVMLG